MFNEGHSLFPGERLDEFLPDFYGTGYGGQRPDAVDTIRKRYFELKPESWSTENSILTMGQYAGMGRQDAFNVQMRRYDTAFSEVHPEYKRGRSSSLTDGRWKTIGQINFNGRRYDININGSPTRLTPSKVDARGMVIYQLVRSKRRRRRRVPIPEHIVVPKDVGAKDLVVYRRPVPVLDPHPPGFGGLIVTSDVLGGASTRVAASTGVALVSAVVAAVALKSSRIGGSFA